MDRFVIVRNVGTGKTRVCLMPSPKFLEPGDYVVYAADGNDNVGVCMTGEFSGDMDTVIRMWSVPDGKMCEIKAALIRVEIEPDGAALVADKVEADEE